MLVQYHVVAGAAANPFNFQERSCGENATLLSAIMIEQMIAAPIKFFEAEISGVFVENFFNGLL